MKIGDYVRITSIGCPGFGYIMGFDSWKDECGVYEMIEILCDNGYPTWLPDDEFEVIDENR